MTLPELETFYFADPVAATGRAADGQHAAAAADGVAGEAALEHRGVGTVAAIELVVAGAANQRVVFGTAIQFVIAGIASQQVGYVIAGDHIVAATPLGVLDRRVVRDRNVVAHVVA